MDFLHRQILLGFKFLLLVLGSTSKEKQNNTCNSSPPAGGSSNINISTISATANSDCPTPEKLNPEFTIYGNLSQSH